MCARYSQVRFAGWGAEYDQWVAKRDVSADLIEAWEAEQAATEDAATRFATETDREQAKLHASTTISFVADTLLTKLRRSKDKKKRAALCRHGPCDQWLFAAIYEHLADGVPLSELSNFMTPVKRTAGARGAPPCPPTHPHPHCPPVCAALLQVARTRLISSTSAMPASSPSSSSSSLKSRAAPGTFFCPTADLPRRSHCSLRSPSVATDRELTRTR